MTNSSTTTPHVFCLGITNVSTAKYRSSDTMKIAAPVGAVVPVTS